MNDLVPLKTLARSELEVSVLNAADVDRAPREALQRVAASLGVSTSLVALSGTAGAASALGALGTGGLVKSLLLGVGAGTLVSGTLLALSVATESPAAPPVALSGPERDAPQSAREGARAFAPSRPADSPGASATVPAVSLETRASSPRPLPRSAASTAPRAGLAAAPVPNATSSVAEEVFELDRARALVAAGNAKDALRVLDAYALRWPDGVMALEASVVRVEVELARGDRASAERHARAVIAAHPNTGHARKVLSLFERAKEE